MHVCVCVSLVSLAITELEKATCVLAISVYAIGIVTSFTVFSAPKVLAYVLAASVSFYLSHCIHAARVFSTIPSSCAFCGAPGEPISATRTMTGSCGTGGAKCATQLTDTCSHSK